MIFVWVTSALTGTLMANIHLASDAVAYQPTAPFDCTVAGRPGACQSGRAVDGRGHSWQGYTPDDAAPGWYVSCVTLRGHTFPEACRSFLSPLDASAPAPSTGPSTTSSPPAGPPAGPPTEGATVAPPPR